MNVWLDDLRPMPEGYDKHVYSAKDAIDLINSGVVKMISLDHDLGDQNLYGSGYEVASAIETGAYLAKIRRIRWQIHTRNTVGAKNMKAALENADRHWSKWEHLYEEARKKRKERHT
ncbi:MAG: hypothetical protein HC814_06565 [Rhodobacteraceae bacterium]|nr:hypothetical protein [Paracoccaceae bacterium]